MNKLKAFGFILLGIAMILIPYQLMQPDDSVIYTDRFLTAPFDDDQVLITSAGQSTDTYIVQDAANSIRLNNLFMPEASSNDLSDVSAMIIVIGYSQMGLSLNDRTFSDEYDRVNSLLQSNQASLPVVAVYLGGSLRRNKQTDQLLELVASKSDVLISVTDTNDDYIQYLIGHYDLSYMILDKLNNLSKPLASIFR